MVTIRTLWIAGHIDLRSAILRRLLGDTHHSQPSPCAARVSHWRAGRADPQASTSAATDADYIRADWSRSRDVGDPAAKGARSCPRRGQTSSTAHAVAWEPAGGRLRLRLVDAYFQRAPRCFAWGLAA